MPIRGIGINVHSSRINGDLDLLDRDLAYFARIGFDYVEIPVHGVDGVIEGEVNYENTRKVAKILQKYNLRSTVHAPDPLNLEDENNFGLQKKVFSSSIDFTREIGAEVLVYHAGKVGKENPSPEEVQKMEKKQEEALKDLARYAKEEKVKICIENEANSIEEILSLVASVNMENVGITYDFGHAFLYYNWCGEGEEKFLTSIKKALPYLKHIHIHDNFGRVNLASFKDLYINRLPFGEGDLHMPPGMGKIPYRKIFPWLKKYTGVAIMEIEPRYWHLYGNALKRLQNLFLEAGIF